MASSLHIVLPVIDQFDQITHLSKTFQSDFFLFPRIYTISNLPFFGRYYPNIFQTSQVGFSPWFIFLKMTQSAELRYIIDIYLHYFHILSLNSTRITLLLSPFHPELIIISIQMKEEGFTQFDYKLTFT